jgi:hypothetical protein
MRKKYICLLKNNKKARSSANKKCDDCNGHQQNCTGYIPLVPISDVIIRPKQ